MMNFSHDPIALVQNPAFGAHLLWSFGRGFQEEKVGDLAPMPSYFLVLPLILHQPTLDEIRATNLPSGLSKLVSKLAKERERLMAIHDRAIRLRELSFQSLGVGTAAGILEVEYESGLVQANQCTLPTTPHSLRFHLSGAQKLGKWFARLPQGQVFALLQVVI